MKPVHDFTRRLYEFSLTWSEYVKLLSIASHLAIDVELKDVRKDGLEVKGYVGYRVETAVGQFVVRPFIILSPKETEKLHYKLYVLEYFPTHMLSIGGGVDIGNVFEYDIADLMGGDPYRVAHMDVRRRRFVLGRSDVRDKGFIVGRIKLWYTLLAFLAGLHRWGLAWRRCAISNIALYEIVSGTCLRDGTDLSLLADSLVELVVNRARLYMVGEELFLNPEVYASLREVMEHASRLLSASRNLGEFLRDLQELRQVILEKLEDDVEILKDVLLQALFGSGKRGDTEEGSRSRQGERRPFLSGVYINSIVKFVNVVDASLKALIEAERRPDLAVALVFATETWSPVYPFIYAFRVLYRMVTRSRYPSTPQDTPWLVILYTPQSLPQVVASLAMFEDLVKIVDNKFKGLKKRLASLGAAKEVELRAEERRLTLGEYFETKVTIEIPDSKSKKVDDKGGGKWYEKPQPYAFTMYELIAKLKKGKPGREITLARIIPVPVLGENVKIMYTFLQVIPALLATSIAESKAIVNVGVYYNCLLTGINSILVALKKLENEDTIKLKVITKNKELLVNVKYIDVDD